MQQNAFGRRLSVHERTCLSQSHHCLLLVKVSTNSEETDLPARLILQPCDPYFHK